MDDQPCFHRTIRNVLWLMVGGGLPVIKLSSRISRSRLKSLGGWIQTKRADFDQQQIVACRPAVRWTIRRRKFRATFSGGHRPERRIAKDY